MAKKKIRSRKKSPRKNTTHRINQPLLFGLVVVASILGTTLAYYLFTGWYVFAQFPILVEVEVTGPTHMGITLNNTALDFGKVPQGGDAKKKIMVSSQKDVTIHTRIIDDDVASIVYSLDPAMDLRAGETKEMWFKANVPINYPQGNYSGVAILTYVRKMPWQ